MLPAYLSGLFVVPSSYRRSLYITEIETRHFLCDVRLPARQSHAVAQSAQKISVLGAQAKRVGPITDVLRFYQQSVLHMTDQLGNPPEVGSQDWRTRGDRLEQHQRSVLDPSRRHGQNMVTLE